MNSLPTTREKLISEGMRQLLAYGYEGVGIGPVLKAVDVPKGSFYYFFKSKDDYVVAIIGAYEQKYHALRSTIFADQSQSPLTRLKTYFEMLECELSDQHLFGGCLYGVIAQTASGRSVAVREALLASFTRWEESICLLLADALNDGEITSDTDINDLAATIVEAYEGAVIRVKATNDIAAFTRFRTKGLNRILNAILA